MNLPNRIFALLQQHGPMTDDELMARLPLETKRPSMRRSRNTLIKRGLIDGNLGWSKRGNRWSIRTTPTLVVPPEIRRLTPGVN